MSKNRNKKNRQGYKGVETQLNEDTKTSLGYVSNPFTIVGDAKPSKTGRSLSMRIRCSDGLIHDYTIAHSELERIFLHDVSKGELIPAEIREYHNKQD